MTTPHVRSGERSDAPLVILLWCSTVWFSERARSLPACQRASTLAEWWLAGRRRRPAAPRWARCGIASGRYRLAGGARYRYLVVSRNSPASIPTRRAGQALRAVRPVVAGQCRHWRGAAVLPLAQRERDRHRRALCQRFGRIRQLARALHRGDREQYDKVLDVLDVEQSTPVSHNTTRSTSSMMRPRQPLAALAGTRTLADTWPGLYCLRSNQTQWMRDAVAHLYHALRLRRCFASQSGSVYARCFIRDRSGERAPVHLGARLPLVCRFQLKACEIDLSWRVRRQLAGQTGHVELSAPTGHRAHPQEHPCRASPAAHLRCPRYHPPERRRPLSRPRRRQQPCSAITASPERYSLKT